MSKVLQRSGRAVIQYANMLEWQPEHVVFVGVGVRHEEAHMIHKEWPDASIVGIEPHPDTVAAIKDSFPGELVYGAAVSEQAPRGNNTNIFARKNWKDGTSVFPPEDGDFQQFNVPSVILRDFLHHKPHTLLWLDCEGSELKATDGATRAIANNVDFINVEMTGSPRSTKWPSPITMHRRLRRLGFYQMWTHTHRCCIGQFDAIYVKHELVNPCLCSCMETLEHYNQRRL